MNEPHPSDEGEPAPSKTPWLFSIAFGAGGLLIILIGLDWSTAGRRGGWLAVAIGILFVVISATLTRVQTADTETVPRDQLDSTSSLDDEIDDDI